MEEFQQFTEAINKLNLKIQALREGFSKKVADITDDYEDRIADLRVQLTITSENNERLQQEVEELKNRLSNYEDQAAQEPDTDTD